MAKHFIILLIIIPLSCSIFALSPLSLSHKKQHTFKKLDISKNFSPKNTEEFENLKRAAEYFNLLIQNREKASWENMLTIYEYITGDYKNPQYTLAIREQRLNTLKNNLICPQYDNYVPDIINLINMTIGTPTTVINEASDLFSYIVKNQVLRVEFEKDEYYYNRLTEHEDKINIQQKERKNKLTLKGALRSMFTGFLSIFHIIDDIDLSDLSFTSYCDKFMIPKGIPGFDKVISNAVQVPFDAHHRWAWFLMNFLLIKNQLAPVYFKDYYEVYDSTPAAANRMKNTAYKYGFEANKSV